MDSRKAALAAALAFATAASTVFAPVASAVTATPPATMAQRAKSYVPNIKDAVLISKTKRQFNSYFESIRKSQGDAAALAFAQTVVSRIDARLTAVTSVRVYFILDSVKKGINIASAGIQSGTAKPAASTGAVSKPAPTETKQLTKDETKTVVSAVTSASDTVQSQYSTAQQLKTIGLSSEDASVMSIKTQFGDDIFFCAPFTGDVYAVESKYSGGNDNIQAAKAYDEWELRVIYKGDVFYQPDEATKKNASRVRVCSNSFRDKTQDQMKALFDKLNLTYTVTRKPFYELGVAHKDVDSWVKGLNIGKSK